MSNAAFYGSIVSFMDATLFNCSMAVLVLVGNFISVQFDLWIACNEITIVENWIHPIFSVQFFLITQKQGFYDIEKHVNYNGSCYKNFIIIHSRLTFQFYEFMIYVDRHHLNGIIFRSN
ncbi:hypothetical protein DERF_005984 [Dermatophagoides farinae]|uniref:Uncharacterized protein n=1 Tax=Dermatophagoides farinae TaxID=6954 RepID=A0A922IAN3_DERFA|nr:hypothetical protein DERF_005984 [Dermatophagoides farinae]